MVSTDHMITYSRPGFEPGSDEDCRVRQPYIPTEGVTLSYH